MVADHAGLGHSAGAFPHAEYAATHCLSIPMFPKMSEEQRDTVISVLQAEELVMQAR